MEASTQSASDRRGVGGTYQPKLLKHRGGAHEPSIVTYRRVLRSDLTRPLEVRRAGVSVFTSPTGAEEFE